MTTYEIFYTLVLILAHDTSFLLWQIYFKRKLVWLLLLSSTRQYLLISKGEVISLWLFLYIQHSQIRSNVTFLFTFWSINVSEAIWGITDIIDFFICSLTCVDCRLHERQEPTLFQARQFKYKALCKRRQHCWMLNVASSLHTLLHVVASWWELSHPSPFEQHCQNGRNNADYSGFVLVWALQIPWLFPWPFSVFQDLGFSCHFQKCS